MGIAEPEIIAGMDEAGRGAWAGPVVAAAVILPKGVKLEGVNDSKMLTPVARERLFKAITKKCDYGVGLASHREVDKFGLLHATFLAYERAIKQLKTRPDHLLIDGRDKFSFEMPHTSIIGGDKKIRAISAASIVAKVSRDKLMTEYESKYPQYGFAAHKGYGTKRHQRALAAHGASGLHRQSYQPIRALKCIQKAFL